MAHLQDLWAQPGQVGRIAQQLGLAPQRKGQRYQARCPRCGQHEAYIPRPRPGEAPVIRCSRRNKCDFSATLFKLLEESTGSKQEAFEVLRAGAAPGDVSSAPPPQPDPAEAYPPESEVLALWSATRPIVREKDPPWPVRDAAIALLESKGIDHGWILDTDIRLTPDPKSFKYPVWWAAGRHPTWSLTTRLFDHRGAARGLHARRIINPSKKPKQLSAKSPDGTVYTTKGLLMANATGRWFLKGGLAPDQCEPGDLGGFVIAEGATDFWWWCACPLTWERHYAVFGMISGSERAFQALRSRWPQDVPTFIATDEDSAGEGYARQIAQALEGTEVKRIRRPS
jgi:hypothetical protein